MRQNDQKCIWKCVPKNLFKYNVSCFGPIIKCLLLLNEMWLDVKEVSFCNINYIFISNHSSTEWWMVSDTYWPGSQTDKQLYCCWWFVAPSQSLIWLRLGYVFTGNVSAASSFINTMWRLVVLQRSQQVAPLSNKLSLYFQAEERGTQNSRFHYLCDLRINHILVNEYYLFLLMWCSELWSSDHHPGCPGWNRHRQHPCMLLLLLLQEEASSKVRLN